MANKRYLMGMLVMALVFGMALVGCAGGADSVPAGAVDPELVGTWVATGEEIVFDDGGFEIKDAKSPLVKGTYSASGGNLAITITQYYGGHPNWENKLQPQWYTKNQLKTAFGSSASDSQIDDLYRRLSGKYSINDDKLNLTLRGFASGTYTRSGPRTVSSQQAGRYMLVNTDTLNVRSGPSADNSIVGTLPRNTRVEIIDRPGQWYKIKAGNIEGYVNSTLLKDEQ